MTLYIYIHCPYVPPSLKARAKPDRVVFAGQGEKAELVQQSPACSALFSTFRDVVAIFVGLLYLPGYLLSPPLRYTLWRPHWCRQRVC